MHPADPPISEFCGLTVRDVDLKNKILNIDHQLQRTSDMKYVIEKTKTNAGTDALYTRYDTLRTRRSFAKTIYAPEKNRRFFIQAFYPAGIQNL